MAGSCHKLGRCPPGRGVPFRLCQARSRESARSLRLFNSPYSLDGVKLVCASLHVAKGRM
jgi:hypothetical protein